MKLLKIVIVAIIVIGVIFSIIAYKNYQNKVHLEQLSEERRQADLEFEQKIGNIRKERYSKYRLIENIGEEYFEKNLTSIEIGKRKRQVINEIPGENYSFYVRLKDINIKDGHRIVSFSSTLMLFGYDIPIISVFYDDDNLLNNMLIPADLNANSKNI